MYVIFEADYPYRKTKVGEAETLEAAIGNLTANAEAKGYQVLASELDGPNDAADVAIGKGFQITLYAIEKVIA